MKRTVFFLAVIICLMAAGVCTPAVAANKHYRVEIFDGVRWNEVEVREALCSDAEHNHSQIWDDWDNSRQLRDTMSFAIFENGFEQAVKVRITRPDVFRNVSIRPSSYKILPYRKTANSIEFAIPSYNNRKLSVEFDGDRQHNLFLIGHRPDSLKPSPDAPGVRYFGPGEHEVGELTLKQGETLYIDYGATVYGCVRITGSDATIAGHGILSGAHLPHRGDVYSCGPCLVVANYFGQYGLVRNLTFRDITMIDSPSWNLTVFNGDNILVDGINMISWELNGDGVDLLSCTNSVVRNCFLRTYDDCITLKVRYTANPMSDLTRILVHDNLIFNDYARGIVVGIENGSTKRKGSGYIHDIEVRDCIILQNSGSEDVSDLRAGIAIGQSPSPEFQHLQGSALKMENIYIHDIIFDNLNPTGRCFSVLQYPGMLTPCTMSNIRIENFRVFGGRRMNTPAGLVITNQHSIRNMTVRNFTVDGKRIKNRGLDFVVIGDADIKFE